MTHYHQPAAAVPQGTAPLRIIRLRQTSQKLNVSDAKVYDMIANGLFPKPFQIVPGGRAVGWLEHEVDEWIVGRRANAQEGAA